MRIANKDGLIVQIRVLAAEKVPCLHIGKQLGIPSSTVHRWAREAEISLPTSSEAANARFAADRKILDAERLREVLSYDPETGVFRWLVSRPGKASAGTVAGKVGTDGHRSIRFGGFTYQAHRLAWLYVHGVWPSDVIDHKDCQPDNNRIANLREATLSQNAANSRLSARNTSGVKGVNWHRATGKWVASIGQNGRRHHLGLFTSIEEAATARIAAANRVYGEFARHE